MKKIILASFLTLSAYGHDNHIDLDDRVTDLEIKSMIRKINMGMELHMFGGFMDKEDKQDSDKNYKSDHWKNNIRLKFNGKLNEKFQAYVSLQASYLFNDQVQTNQESDHDTINPSQGSSPYIRTAYFDWKLTDNMILSAGRLPTTFGPPEHMRHGRARLGTYPISSFNLPIDGLSLTWRLPSFHSSSLTSRTIYLPGSITDSFEPYAGTPYNESNPGEFADNHEGFTQMLELKVNGDHTSLFENLLIIGQYSYLRMGAFVETTTQAQLIPNTDDKNEYKIYADNDTLSYLSIFSFYTEVEKIFDSNFDFYFSYMKSRARAAGNIKADVIGDATTAGSISTIDLGNFIANDDARGTRTLYGLRYNLEHSFFGGEYWKSTSNPVPNDLYTDDFISLGQIVGEVFHGYYTHQFYGGDLSTRVGYVRLNKDKTFSSFSLVDSNEKIDSVYTALFVTF